MSDSKSFVLSSIHPFEPASKLTIVLLHITVETMAKLQEYGMPMGTASSRLLQHPNGLVKRIMNMQPRKLHSENAELSIDPVARAFRRLSMRCRVK